MYYIIGDIGNTSTRICLLNKSKILKSIIFDTKNIFLKGYIKKIFNPYFTTKKNGTGLGLSIVSKIINDHNGKIEFIPLEEGAKIKIDFIK